MRAGMRNTTNQVCLALCLVPGYTELWILGYKKIQMLECRLPTAIVRLATYYI